MAKPKPDEERKLYVKLDVPELILKGEKHARLVLDLKAHGEHQKKVAADLKATGDALSADIVQFATEIDQKRELRPVRCRWEMGTKEWVLSRVDTGEVVDTAPITMADRQQELLS